jgi:CRISPR-associated protein Csy2
MRTILLIPKLKIINANALSSPYTIGFPAMTAWLGGVHALERQLKNTDYKNTCFRSTAVICHNINLQIYKDKKDYQYSIIEIRKPLVKQKNKKRKDPNNFITLGAAPLIESPRVHLIVSIIIECLQLAPTSYNKFTETIDNFLMKMKFASGDITECKASKIFEIKDETNHKQLMRQLMPGHCLIERKDLMLKEMKSGNDAMDSLLNYIKITNKFNNGNNWTKQRKENGWIIPIATGFHGITNINNAENQRDPTTPHRFAESIVTLGEFIMPHRINNLDEMLWHYETDLNNDLYLCKQNKPII